MRMVRCTAVRRNRHWLESRERNSSRRLVSKARLPRARNRKQHSMEIGALIDRSLAYLWLSSWLVAGAIDYLCHRRTNIELTSGATESWLHIAQFVTVAAALGCAVLMRPSPASLFAIVALILTHTVLAFIDVSYTDGRRRITPVEQHAHGFLLVVPIVAVVLFAIQHWSEVLSRTWRLQWVAEIEPAALWLVFGFCVIAGVPVAEELARTLRNGKAASIT